MRVFQEPYLCCPAMASEASLLKVMESGDSVGHGAAAVPQTPHYLTSKSAAATTSDRPSRHGSLTRTLAASIITILKNKAYKSMCIWRIRKKEREIDREMNEDTYTCMYICMYR